jgi:hypothetical protein
MTKNHGKFRRKMQFKSFDPFQNSSMSDDSDSQSNSSYDGNLSDDNSPDFKMNQNSGNSPAPAMNVNANSFKPTFGSTSGPASGQAGRHLTASAQTFNPTSNPYSHTAMSSNGGHIQITPTKVSAEDIYEYQRLPSGVVITTSSGQEVEFWERVHVPDAQKQHSSGWQDRNNWQ